jgi:RNA polymerase sigma-70 factor, ECF subfamily
MSSCGVCLEAPSWVHTGVARSLFPEGHGNFLWKNWEYWAGRKRSFRQMQTCLSKICFPQTRVVAEISIDDLPELERDARARARRCLRHILAMLRRPRTVLSLAGDCPRTARRGNSGLSSPSGRNDRWKNAMATVLTMEYPLRDEDLQSRKRVVNLFVLKKPEGQGMSQEHEVASFEALMLPHLDAAHNLARWLVRNEDDAQDIVQEAYLRALKSFHGFRGSDGRAWLLKIVRNTAYTWLRKNRAVELATFDEEIHISGCDTANPAVTLEKTEDAEAIREAMEDLAVEFREILVLRHLEGLSYKEIADIAQIPPGTVMSRLARARARLKECLGDRLGKEK